MQAGLRLAWEDVVGGVLFVKIPWEAQGSKDRSWEAKILAGWLWART